MSGVTDDRAMTSETAPEPAAAGPGPTATPAYRRSLRREILRLAWPAILEYSLHTMVWLVDVAFVGRISAEALSATGLGGQVYFFALFLFGAVSTAATAMIARRIGAGQPAEGARIAGQLGVIGLGLGLVVTALIWLISPLVFAATQLGPEVSALGVSYQRILSLGAPMFILRSVLVGAMHGFGDTRSPMVIAAIAGLFNIFADWALIQGRLGLPPLGVAGAATASALAHVLGAVILLFILAKRLTPARVDFRRALQFQWPVLRTTIRLGLPAAGEHLLTDSARTIGVFIIAYIGVTAVAAHEVTVAVESLSFMPGWGFAIATSIIVGQSLGRGDPARARAAVREAALIAVAFGLTMSALMLLFPGPLVGLFTTDATVRATATRLLRIAGLVQPLIAIQGVCGGALRGAGDTRSPMIAGGVSSWLVRLSITYVAVILLGLPVDWVWWAMLGDWLVRATWLWVVYRRGRWQEVQV